MRPLIAGTERDSLAPKPPPYTIGDGSGQAPCFKATGRSSIRSKIPINFGRHGHAPIECVSPSIGGPLERGFTFFGLVRIGREPLPKIRLPLARKRDAA